MDPVRAIQQSVQPALRVVIAVAGEDEGLRRAGEELDVAFGHSSSRDSYLTSVGKIDQIEYRRCQEEPPDDLEVDQAWHTLLVVLVDRDVTAEWRRWLDEVVPRAAASGGRHKVVAFAADEATQGAVADSGCELARVQLNLVTRFGERALRPAVLGLIAINEARRLLARACDPDLGRHLKLFISHAKADGLPLAHSLVNQIAAIPRTEKFYDDSELLLSSDWRTDLDENISSSTVLIVRTDRFDDRPVCRDEVLSADRFACPVLVVDARQALVLEESRLPLGDLATVKLQDGNVYRALHSALWVGLRGLCLARSVRHLKDAKVLTGDRVRVLHRSPTFGAVRRLCSELAAAGSGDPVLVYPGPDLDDDQGEALRMFAEARLPGVRLATVEQLFLEGTLQT